MYASSRNSRAGIATTPAPAPVAGGVAGDAGGGNSEARHSGAFVATGGASGDGHADRAGYTAACSSPGGRHDHRWRMKGVRSGCWLADGAASSGDRNSAYTRRGSADSAGAAGKPTSGGVAASSALDARGATARM
eukprot:366436-Chlamydomonas_euryale.AAC.38